MALSQEWHHHFFSAEEQNHSLGVSSFKNRNIQFSPWLTLQYFQPCSASATHKNMSLCGALMLSCRQLSPGCLRNRWETSVLTVFDSSQPSPPDPETTLIFFRLSILLWTSSVTSTNHFPPNYDCIFSVFNVNPYGFWMFTFTNLIHAFTLSESALPGLHSKKPWD